MDSGAYKLQVAEAFDEAAAAYDRLVGFFTPMGRQLVERAAPTAGERVLDVGCGRGACLFPAAARVGASGRAVGIDIAPGMIEEAGKEARLLGLDQVELHVMDAERPEFADRTFDVVMGSYSIIFLPDAPAALARYARLLVPGGRMAFTSPVFVAGTFPFLPPVFTDLIPMSLLSKLPQEWRPERLQERFNSWLEDPAELAATVRGAGFTDVEVTDVPIDMVAPSGETWVEWSHTQGMRLLWQHLPADEAAALRERLIPALDAMRTDGGPLRIPTPVRFVTAVR
ncbi:class I SAM-dependent methyltransferase [Streptomyces griseus]|uniref:class I SAM-dependent methyltransferase n=1 Tax=Streptomyces griseus TaxID=1911 RepID=UPI0005658008|nr:class I SAM-dependent methyltransferase [Streptomyces griseus]